VAVPKQIQSDFSPKMPMSVLPDAREVELKFAVPLQGAQGAQSLLRRLMRSSTLRRRKSDTAILENHYYDTPDGVLGKRGIALRVRRVERAGVVRFVQTLKVAGVAGSALSARGEWESDLSGPTLQRSALIETPWASIDPDGRLWDALEPHGNVVFTRTTWQVRRRDGSVVEVAFDHGELRADTRRAPLCELELELQAGPVSALFELARELVPLVLGLPESRSKAARCAALREDILTRPVRARAKGVATSTAPRDWARVVLREIFNHFVVNLISLRESDDVELVHQARVGWRRLSSACRLLRPLGVDLVTPQKDLLRPLLGALGMRRDLDVARMETLPGLRSFWIAGAGADRPPGSSPSAAARIDAALEVLEQHAARALQQVRDALSRPELVAALLELLVGIETWEVVLPGADRDERRFAASLRKWSRKRVVRVHERWRDARRSAHSVEERHEVRILAKRVRYAIEVLYPWLKPVRAARWLRRATAEQAALGCDRDVLRASELIGALHSSDGELRQFLLGVAVGRGAWVETLG